jgi:CDP-diacylglycerol--glycerol-3-phosphate 3-phosphatidyltransferase
MLGIKAQQWNTMVFWNNIPNSITTIRILMLFPILCFLYTDSIVLKLITIASLIVLLLMDKLDGFYARRYNQATKFGCVFDIAGDRIIEISFWMIFAHLKLIPVWVPVVIITRGIITDSLRGYALSKDKTPFGKDSMLKSRLTEFIVGSNFMRAVANVKIIAFIVLILATIYPQLAMIGLIITYISVFVNLLRGLPVVVDARV